MINFKLIQGTVAKMDNSRNGSYVSLSPPRPLTPWHKNASH
jgi:hypothetical protein